MSPDKLTSLLFGLLCALAWGQAPALPSDREEPIHIQSDRAQQDGKRGITVYQGEVRIKQGTLRIQADQVTIHSENDRWTRIVATGKPAHFEQRPQSEKQLVVAEAGTIVYRLDDEMVVLTEDATIEQEGTSLSGERIDYDIRQALVKAVGGDRNDRDRIHMVIPPQPPAEADTDSDERQGED